VSTNQYVDFLSISLICVQGVFGDKTEYATLTRLSYCQCRLKLVFDAICKKYGWKHLAVVYDKMDLFSFTVGKHSYK